MQATLPSRATRWWHFGAEALVAALSPSTYTRPVRALVARQICVSAWQVVPHFVLACTILGALVIRIIESTARDFGLSGYVLDLYARLLVLELIPLFVALFVALRSGAAIGTVVALLRARGELEPLRRDAGETLRTELLPRGIGVAVAVLALTAISCAAALAVAYVALYGLSPWGHAAYGRAIGQVFAPAVLAGFALKVAFFAVAVAVIPVGASLGGERDMRAVPGAAPRGLVLVFVVLALVETVSLAIKYA